MPLKTPVRKLTAKRLCVLLVVMSASWPCRSAPPAAPPRPIVQQPKGPIGDRFAKLIADGTAALATNDPSRAQLLFEQAFRIKSAPELLYQLGKVAESQGQVVTAADLYRRYLESGAAGTADPAADALRNQIAAIPPSTSEVTVAGSGGALLSVDGRLLGALPLHRPLLLAPGPHRYRLEARGTSSESDPLTVPDGRTAELHLTAGSSGSLIAVLTVNSLAILSLDAAGLSDDKQKQADDSIAAAARSEHTIILSPDKVRELIAAEPPSCLQSAPCLDRIAKQSEVRYLLTFSLKAQSAPNTVGVRAELFDLASGLAAATIEENTASDSLGTAMVTLTRRLFQTALSRPRGMLHIDSIPQAATVSVDDRVLGETPLERVTLSGNHRVTVSHTNCEPYQAALSVAPGATASLHAELTPKALSSRSPPPVLVTAPGESSVARTLRWAIGGIGVTAGLTLTGLGASALAQNGSCGDHPVPSSGAPCELLYNTGLVGGVVLGAGLGLTVGGALVMLWPGRKPRQVASQAQ